MKIHLGETPLSNKDIASAYLQNCPIKAGPFRKMLFVYWGGHWHLYRVTSAAYALFLHRENFQRANLCAKSGLTYLSILAAQ